MTITLEEYRRREPSLTRPMTDTMPERVAATVTPRKPPSARDLIAYERREASRRARANTPRMRHCEAVQEALGFRWDLSVIRPLLAEARAVSRAMRGLR